MRGLKSFFRFKANHFILNKTGRNKKIKTEKLITKNRADIELRVEFLKDVLDEGKSFHKTTYYWFIGDENRWAYREPEKACKEFLSLFKDIKKNELRSPITVCKPRSSFVIEDKTHNDKKQIKTKYQLQDGAHRLAIFKYLGRDDVPCRVYSPILKKYPDYTNYIKKRRNFYTKRKNGTYS